MAGQEKGVYMKEVGKSGAKILRLTFLAQLVHNFSQRDMMVDLTGSAKSHFYYQNGFGGGRFKQNQRKERALSRRRKMKPGARN